MTDSLRAPGRVETRHLFRPLLGELVALLRSLGEEDWERPAVGAWWVRDVVAHLTDVSARRLSYQRDGFVPPPPQEVWSDFPGLVAFLDGLNAEWVRAMRRVSPGVLTDWLAATCGEAVEVYEATDPDAPALFPVAWAGEERSAAWFDVGRDYTEWWHHQQQIRAAVGEPLQTGPRWLAPVLALTVRALPRAYGEVDAAEEGTAVVLRITGLTGGIWSVVRSAGGWALWEGEAANPSARVTVDEDTAWRWLLKAMPGDDAAAKANIEGDERLGRMAFGVVALMA